MEASGSFSTCAPAPTASGRRFASAGAGAAGRPLRAPAPAPGADGLTLVELLIVLTIIVLLASLLVPSVQQARSIARIARGHCDLRSITTALHVYRESSDGRLPPVRLSCSTRTAYELPVELARLGLLPRTQKGGVDIVETRDPFTGAAYLYRAPGPAILNETVLVENASTLWVPAAFPDCRNDLGRYVRDRDTSPVRYAVWTDGPDPNSDKMRQIPGRRPLPQRFWCRSAGDTGVITHAEQQNGTMLISD